jgi:hypothetical protein
MAITIDWGTRIIYIPRNDLTLIQSSPVEIRELNLNWFRLQLKDLEDSEEGMAFPDTHRHNTEVYLGGLTFARVIEIINNYSLLFEDGQYAVNLVGANSNVGDRVNVNQVSVRSANSAGLISSPAIEYSSYNQGVTVDIESSFTGTVFPVGTPQAPVNNLADAILICQYRGFDTIFVKRSMTIDSGGDYHGYTFIGESYTKTVITVSNVANVFECEFRDAQLAGILDGGSVLRGCRIFDLDYIDGIVEDCILDANGTILLSGSRFANIINCVSGRLDTLADIIPIIDMGGSGTSLGMRNYSGAIQIINKNGPENIDIDLSSGVVVLDETVTGGTIQVRGAGQLIDNSNGAIVDSAGLISKASIVDAIEDTIGPEIEYSSFNCCVTIDVTSVSSGIAYPKGTPLDPVNNLEDALLIAAERGFDTLYINSSMEIGGPFNVSDFTINGESHVNISIMVSSETQANNITINDCTVSGVLDDNTEINNCVVGDISHFNGHIHNSSLTGKITLGGGLSTYIRDCARLDMNTQPTIDMGGSGQNLVVPGYTGLLIIKNITGSSVKVGIGLIAGHIRLDSSTITGGLISVSGIGTLTDESGNNISSGVWHGATIINTLIDNSGGLTEEEHDKLLSLPDESDMGTIVTDAINEEIGPALLRMLGLLQENQYLDQTTYTIFNGQKLLSSGRIRTYSDAVSVGTTNNVIATYNITTTWNGDEMQSYKVVKV